ncbi:MAG: hypothetical protein P9M14_09475 [Candidatus Alcyoniella australis]|nr:hypothetical protein [Candidatus Alcyoniella australis]
MTPEQNRGRRRRKRKRTQDSGQLPGGYAGPDPIVLTHHSFTADPQKRRRNNNRSNQSNSQRNRQQDNNRGQQQNQRRNNQPSRAVNGSSELNALQLFSLYHLGLTPEGQYRQQNVNDIARRFNKSPEEIRQLLVDFGIDSDTMLNTEFDVSLAQLDIQVAPEGINKHELAKSLYQDFLDAPRKTRDWHQEIAKDAEENKKTFGK